MKRGHNVTLFEKNSELGGALYYVSLPDFKLDYKDYTEYMIRETKAVVKDIRTDTEVTADLINGEAFDIAIVATGAETFIPGIPRAEKGGILDPLKVLDGREKTGNRVIVCGAGLVGCEVAMVLAEQGKDVTMVDMLPTAAPELAIYTKWVLDAKLAELGVKVKVNHKITEMTDQHIICDCQGETYTYEGDSVICALGLKPNRTLVDELREKCGKTEIIPVGDVNKPRKIMQATHEGFHAARRI